jgi:hypothetical protein
MSNHLNRQTLAVLKHAQALEDLESLRKHGRRVLRVHLHGVVPPALAALRGFVAAALSGRQL